jgi:steroid delta-isomerase-like uncharacterized protein
LCILKFAAKDQRMTVDLIRSYYETFNAGNREAFLKLLSPNVVHDLNQGGTEIGTEMFRLFLQRMDRSYREQVEDLEIMVSPTNPNRAAAEFYIRGTYLKTDSDLPPAVGQTYHLRVGAFFEVKDGLIERITNYYNLEEWIRQITLA